MQKTDDSILKHVQSQSKRTKILVTIGPATHSFEKTVALIKAGANGFRLNSSHGTNEERTQQIKWIRKASKEYGIPVAIVQDLQGPKIRLGDFDGVINVQKGHDLSFALDADYEKTGHIPTQYDLSKKAKRGERLYIFDGRVKLTISSVKDGVIRAKAENDGILIRRKGMNLPDTDFGGDVITAKDRLDLVYGSAQDIDYVALSFVQTAEDITKLQKLLKSMNSTAKVIAKIETSAAVENIEEIVQVSDAIMIARGDLAVETPAESVPLVQRKIVGLGLNYAKPTIVATQMLASMTDSPEPTRAEVSDVATATLMGADCLMLSEETASGHYPIEAVGTMHRIVEYTENNGRLDVLPPLNEAHTRQIAISTAVLSLAESISAQAIVTETKSGATALRIGSHRSSIPLFAVTSVPRTAQQLAITFNVRSFVRPVDRYAANKLTDLLRAGRMLKKGDIVVTTSGQHPGVVGSTDTIKVRMVE